MLPPDRRIGWRERMTTDALGLCALEGAVAMDPAHHPDGILDRLHRNSVTKTWSHTALIAALSHKIEPVWDLTLRQFVGEDMRPVLLILNTEAHALGGPLPTACLGHRHLLDKPRRELVELHVGCYRPLQHFICDAYKTKPRHSEESRGFGLQELERYVSGRHRVNGPALAQQYGIRTG